MDGQPTVRVYEGAHIYLKAPAPRRKNFFHRALHPVVSWSLIVCGAGMFICYGYLAYLDAVNSRYIPVEGNVLGVRTMARRTALVKQAGGFQHFKITTQSDQWYGFREIVLMGGPARVSNFKVSASSFFEHQVPALAFDGNEDTAWAAGTKQDTLTIHAPSRNQVSAIRLLPVSYGTAAASVTHVLSGSADGVRFVNLAIFSGPEAAGSWLEWNQ